MDNRPIGVFDSGLGGLTAVKELLEIMPQEDIVYFGDTGRVPYGSRSQDTLIKYAAQDIHFLEEKQVKMIVIACGTISSLVGRLKKPQDLPIIDVLYPTALAASLATHNKRVGVIGTSTPIHSGSYRRVLAEIDPQIQVFDRDCPLFVPLVESGFIEEDEPVTRLVAERYLGELRDAGVDTLIMGCTHYPIISRIIGSIMGKGVTLINSGRETAFCCRKQLEESGLLSGRTSKGQCSYYVSDRMADFSKIAGIFLGRDIGQEVHQIDIDRY